MKKICKKCPMKKKIKKLKALLKDAYIDDCFNIYTRKGFLNCISGENSGHITLLDFNGLSKMNQKHGYKKVNEIITSFFEEIKNDELVIGRWFSGDEIVIYAPFDRNFNIDLDNIKYVADEMGLEFSYTRKHVSEVENWTKEIENMESGLIERK